MEVEVQPEPGVDYAIEFIGTRRGFDMQADMPTSASGRARYASRRYHDDIGEVFARRTGTKAIDRFGQNDLYVRARITANRAHPLPSYPLQMQQAWVQPILGPAGGSPSRRHLLSSQKYRQHLDAERMIVRALVGLQ